jgi:hypothetical protein
LVLRLWGSKRSLGNSFKVLLGNPLEKAKKKKINENNSHHVDGALGAVVHDLSQRGFSCYRVDFNARAKKHAKEDSKGGEEAVEGEGEVGGEGHCQDDLDGRGGGLVVASDGKGSGGGGYFNDLDANAVFGRFCLRRAQEGEEARVGGDALDVVTGGHEFKSD